MHYATVQYHGTMNSFGCGISGTHGRRLADLFATGEMSSEKARHEPNRQGGLDWTTVTERRISMQLFIDTTEIGVSESERSFLCGCL